MLCVLHSLLKHTTLSLSPPGRLGNVLSESLYLLHGALPPYHERTVGGWGWWACRYMSLPLTIPSLLPRLHTVVTCQTKVTKCFWMFSFLHIRHVTSCIAVKKLSFVYQADPKSLVQAPLVDVLWKISVVMTGPRGIIIISAGSLSSQRRFSVIRKLENKAKCRINYFPEVLKKLKMNIFKK